ncbi:hypothetical protein UlMin_013048 [Ulmus minor]
MEILLHRIPGRMCLNGSSDLASLFTKLARKGINRDALVVWENFSLKEDAIFCGVFDGHDPFGHMVAKKVRDSLPLRLSTLWELIRNPENEGIEGNSDAKGSLTFDGIASTLACMHIEKHNEIFSTLKDAFLRAFEVVDKELKLHPHIDCYCIETTAVTLGQDLVIGNIGDSRAVLGSRDKDDSLVVVQLIVDLKPSVPREAKRIRLCKRQVFSLKDEPEVARVWLPNVDSPGLAMAWVFGDFFLKEFVLISVPKITHRRLTKEDEFVILATDGIWDVLSNEEVVKIVASTAARLWRLKFRTSKVDDCAVVCLFLNSAPNETSISTANQKTMPDLLDACNDMHVSTLGLDHTGNLDYYWTIKDFIRTDGGHPQ